MSETFICVSFVFLSTIALRCGNFRKENISFQFWAASANTSKFVWFNFDLSPRKIAFVPRFFANSTSVCLSPITNEFAKSYSEEKYFVRWPKLYNVPRKKATYSQGYAVFKGISSNKIPIYTKIQTENKILFEPIESPYAKRIKGIVAMYERVSKSVSDTIKNNLE